MRIENDTAEIISGVKGGISLASPIALLIRNKDCGIDSLHKVVSPRPGHADLAGSLKYDQGIRAVLERSSARETAMRKLTCTPSSRPSGV
jgi:chorismate synthase